MSNSHSADGQQEISGQDPITVSSGLQDGAVRVGFVGVGGIAGYHLANLARIPQARIEALCDIYPEAAQRVAHRLEEEHRCSPAIYTDFHAMLDEQELDALYVCVPPFAHDSIEVSAAERGLALFVEKPVALTLESALRNLEAIRAAGVIAATGYLLRYWASTQAARQFLQGRQISLVACDRWSGVPGGPEFWWRDMSRSGGQLHEMTTHQVDLMRYLAGEIVRVDTRHSHGVLGDFPNLTVPDSQIAMLEFASGAIGYISNSCVMTRGGHRTKLEFVLRDQVLSWGETLSLDPSGENELPELPETSRNIDEAFIAAVASQQPGLVLSPYDEAVRTLAVTVAARESAEKAASVSVARIH